MKRLPNKWNDSLKKEEVLENILVLNKLKWEGWKNCISSFEGGGEERGG